MGKRVMPVRNKMLWFRLSESEFSKAMAACNSAGSRSMSDFLRDVILDRVERTVDPIQELETRVGALEAQMATVLKSVNS